MSEPVQVSVDDKLTARMVHWNTDLESAEHQAHEWGFRGIEGFEKVEVLNGNAARTEALNIALRRYDDGVRCFWRGSYDWGATADSAIYSFGYDSYVGDSQVHGDNPEAKAHADWSPERQIGSGEIHHPEPKKEADK